MAVSASRAVWGVVFSGATGVVTAFTALYWNALLQQAGLLMVLPIALFVAGQIFLIARMQKSANPAVRAAGAVLGTAMQHLALFEGLVFTTLVFWALARIFGYSLPDTWPGYATEFALGSLWFSLFVFGGTGGTALLGGVRGAKRVAAILYTLVALAVPLAVAFVFAETVRAYGAAHPAALLTAAILYHFAASVAGMELLSPGK